MVKISIAILKGLLLSGPAPSYPVYKNRAQSSLLLLIYVFVNSFL